MKEREGCIKTNYNAQAAVEEENQFIIANDVTNECNDKKQLIPMIEQVEENIKNNVDKVKADSGYHSADNLEKIENMNVDAYIDDPLKARIDNENFKYDKVNFDYDEENDVYKCPEGKELINVRETENEIIYKGNDCCNCPVKNDCLNLGNNKKPVNKKIIKRKNNEKFVEINRKKLLSENGRKEYKTRMHTVEPAFGNIKFNTGFKYFLLRGLEKVKGEFNLACIGHNIKKISSFMTKNGSNISNLSLEVLK